MPTSLAISAETARRFILGKQGLWPGRRWTGRAGTRAAARAVEHLQLDPLVIVARSHDLMLHSRVADYRPEHFDHLAYKRREFFDWGGWLAVRPMSELPYWRVLMDRNREHHPELGHNAKVYAGAIEEVRNTLRERGTVSGRDFAASDREAVTSYRGSKDTSVALYYLWRTGEAMTHHREGFERVYALTEAVAPAHLLEPVSEAEADRFHARKLVAYQGIGRISALSGWLSKRVTAAEQQALERDLVDAGEIVLVAVEGWRGAHYALASDVRLLREVARGGVPAKWRPLDTTSEDEVTLLSPLDPVSARGRAKTLFDFDYKWEIYHRAEDMRFGRYTMPILWGDRLVGRLDPKLDRASATLIVNNVWFEDPATARDAAFLAALALGVRRLMTFLDVERVSAAGVTSRPVRAAITALNPSKARTSR